MKGWETVDDRTLMQKGFPLVQPPHTPISHYNEYAKGFWENNARTDSEGGKKGIFMTASGWTHIIFDHWG